MRWTRIVGYGVLLWLVPFLISLALFDVRQADRSLFESLITVVGVGSAVVGSLLFFQEMEEAGATTGIEVGLIWMSLSILLDLPIFIGVFGMPLAEYLADIALGYLAFPLIVTGVAAACASGRATAEPSRSRNIPS